MCDCKLDEIVRLGRQKTFKLVATIHKRRVWGIRTMRCETLTSNRIKRKYENLFKFQGNTDQVVDI